MALKIEIDEIEQMKMIFMTDLEELAHEEFLYELEMEEEQRMRELDEVYSDQENWYSD